VPSRALDGFGVRLGLEVIGVESARTGRGIRFVHRLEEFDRRVGWLWEESPTLGVIVDSLQLYAAGEGLEAGLRWEVERIVAAHFADLPAGAPPDRNRIRDGDRGIPGENGAIDCQSLLARLSAHRYHGPVTAEAMTNCRTIANLQPAEAARVVASASRAIWPSVGEGD